MLFEYTVDFYNVLTGVHYMRSQYVSDHDISSKHFDQELVNNVGLVDGWQEEPKFYVVVERLDQMEGWVRRHHFNSMHFKGVRKADSK